MFKNPILKAKFDDYINKYELWDESESDKMKKYICYTYISQIQPDRLDRDVDLLDKICDSELLGYDIIGFVIVLNNQLLSIKTDIDDILQKDRKANFEIYILTHEKGVDIDAFLNGIKKQNSDFADIIRYMNSQDIILKWEDLPVINLIKISDEINETVVNKSDIYVEKIYTICENKLLSIAKSNENDYTPILEFAEEFTLENDKEQTVVALCRAEQLIKILKNEDDMIRANIFDSNVRAYQGSTDVNNEMMKTLKKCPENFVLYNNGITIVCNKLERKGKSIRIEMPQVVNGCQTCNSLFIAYKEGIDLSKVKVIVKTIETNGELLAQEIVRGTNRQNIVYEEAFETIRQFHKDLEDFFNIMEVKGFYKVYYERRSKQYYFDTQIKPYQKISFRLLIQSMVALYMNKVEISHRHESKLITEYKDKLFVDGQSFYPYYVAALLTTNLDYLLKKEKKYKDVRNYKMHILFVLQEMNMGMAPDINNKDEIEDYCKRFLEYLSDNKFEKIVASAVDRFRKLMKKWINLKGNNYRFAIKDRPEFTEFMIEELRGNKKRVSSECIYHGKVIKLNKDKYGSLYGFIENVPNNIYFNELDNPEINVSYIGKEVSYRIAGRGNETRAINVRVV